MIAAESRSKLKRFAVYAFLFVLSLPARSAEELPNASNVVHRLVKRAQLVAQAEQTNHYTYEKRSVVAELDANDRVIKSTEKLYHVTLIGGLPFPRLVKIQGRDLTPAELEKQNQREEAFRRKVTHVDFHKKAKTREGLATQDLVDRFEFKTTGRDMIEGRPTLEITFAAKPNWPEESMEDKIYKHVAGTVWVDEQEAEITKLDAGVRGPVPLGWFGAIGSLNKFHAVLERTRMHDGVWVNRKSTFLIIARRLWTAIRTQTSEESSGFRKE